MISTIIVTTFHPERIYLGQTKPNLNVRLTLESMLYQSIIKEIILINQAPLKKSWGDPQIDFIKKRFSKTISIIDLKERFPFNKSWCLNIGIKASKYPFIMVNDIDCIVEPYFSQFVSDQLKKNDKQLDNFVMYSQCHGHHQNENINWCNFSYKKDFYTVFPKLFKQSDTPDSPGAPGPLITQKQNLVNIHGYDERFCQLGQEDSDIFYRLKRNNCTIYRHSYQLIHQPHTNVYDDNIRRSRRHRGYVSDSRVIRNDHGWGEPNYPRTEQELVAKGIITIPPPSKKQILSANVREQQKTKSPLVYTSRFHKQ